MPVSSQASGELSTTSLTVVSRALRGLSKPSRVGFERKFADGICTHYFLLGLCHIFRRRPAFVGVALA